MKNLVIVESPSKSKTIEKYLGKDYKVVSSKGHIRDLATRGKEGLGVDLEDRFKPTYVISKDKKDNIYDEINLKCNIYRAEKIDGTYTKISSEPTSCMGDIAFIDTNIENNKTYFYKAFIIEDINNSQIIEVNTNVESKEEAKQPEESKKVVEKKENKTSEKENPKTGFELPVIFILVLSAIFFLLKMLPKRKML